MRQIIEHLQQILNDFNIVSLLVAIVYMAKAPLLFHTVYLTKNRMFTDEILEGVSEMVCVLLLLDSIRFLNTTRVCLKHLSNDKIPFLN